MPSDDSIWKIFDEHGELSDQTFPFRSSKQHMETIIAATRSDENLREVIDRASAALLTRFAEHKEHLGSRYKMIQDIRQLVVATLAAYNANTPQPISRLTQVAMALTDTVRDLAMARNFKLGIICPGRSKYDLTAILLSTLSDVPLNVMALGKTDQEQFRRLAEVSGELDHTNLHVADSSCDDLHKAMREHDLDFLLMVRL